MRTRNIAAIAAGLWLSGSAGAHEVDLGFFSTFEYDDNAFNSESDPVDDVVFRAGPILGLKHTQGDLVYDLRYEPRWESYIDQSGLDAWDHSVFGRVTWRFEPQTRVEASNRFLYTRSLNRSTFIADPSVEFSAPDPELEFDRELVKQNAASLALVHNWTERLESRVTMNQSIFRVDGEDRFDSDTLGLQNDNWYTITAKDRLGGGAGVTWQSFDPSDGSEGGSETFIYSLYALWMHTFSPTLTLSARLGPGFIDTEDRQFAEFGVVTTFPFQRQGGGVQLVNPASCPNDDGVAVFDETRCQFFGTVIRGADAQAISSGQTVVFLDDDAGDSSSRLTYLANLELVKRWERVRARVAYSRNESTSSGVGQSTVLDVLSGQVTWTPSVLWTVSFLGTVSKRESATDELAQSVGIVPVQIVGASGVFSGGQSVSLRLVETDDNIDVLSYTASLRAARKLTRRSEAFGRVEYFKQDSNGETGARTFDNFRALLGFRWMFDPLIL